jgi:hypothetical protein
MLYVAALDIAITEVSEKVQTEIEKYFAPMQ